MKVLHIGKFYPPVMGGIETHLQHLAEELKYEFDVDVEIVATNDDRHTLKEWVNGISVTRVATFGNLISSPLAWGLSREIASIPADIVHLHSPNPLAMNAYLRSRHNGKLVITHHGDIVERSLARAILKSALGPIIRKCFSKAEVILVGNQTFLEASYDLLPYREKCRVVPLGFNFSILNGTGRIMRPKPIVLYVGRLVRLKGLDYLISAMRGIDAALLIVGDGPERQRLAAMSGTNVEFLGRIPQKELGDYYRAAAVFVLPSIDVESFGQVQLEAMYCGVPVINTALPRSGAAEVSINGLTGLTVPPRSVAHLHNAIQAIILGDKLRTFFSGNASKRARLFTLKAMAEGTYAAYSDVMNGRSHAVKAGQPF